MALNQQASNLVDTTVNAFNGEATSVSAIDGISLIDTWTSALRDSDQSTNPVVSGLSDLKTELQSGNPDGSHIQSILEDLADQVKQAAKSAETDVASKLSPLAEALQGFSQQLGGSSKMADAHNQQAPMTSTVGGESTTSGTGASAFYTNNNDDLSNRNGGTVATLSGDEPDEPETGMDDPTGSDGGSGGMDPDNEPSETASNNSAMGMDDDSGSEGGMHPPSKSQYGSGSGSTGDDYGTDSNTQRSGVSGGSADSGSGSSGGRSQY